MSIPPGITAEDVLNAIAVVVENGPPPGLGDSKGYDLLYGKHVLPPKAVVGIAAMRHNDGEVFTSFSGGEGAGKANAVLRALSFDVRPKPLVLNQYRSGSSFKDLVGEQYHYPANYHGRVCPTPREFVYYEPRDGGQQVYFGSGILASTCEDTEDPGWYYGDITQYRAFKQEVPYATSGLTGGPIEDHKYMRSSVRRIDRYLYRRILERGGLRDSVSAVDLEELPDDPFIAGLGAELANASSGKPSPKKLAKKRSIVERYERPSSVTRWVKSVRGCTCQVCGVPGFKKKTGDPYCEVHHLFHLSENPPADCLSPDYVIVVCANCHRRLHFADASEPIQTDNGWVMTLDGEDLAFPVDWE